MLTPSTCSRHQPPRYQDGEKLGGGLGTKQRVHLGAQVSEIWRVIKTRTLLRGLDEVGQLLHEGGQLFCEVHLLTASRDVAGGHKFSDLPSLTPALML